MIWNFLWMANNFFICFMQGIVQKLRTESNNVRIGVWILFAWFLNKKEGRGGVRSQEPWDTRYTIKGSLPTQKWKLNFAFDILTSSFLWFLLFKKKKIKKYKENFPAFLVFSIKAQPKKVFKNQIKENSLGCEQKRFQIHQTRSVEVFLSSKFSNFPISSRVELSKNSSKWRQFNKFSGKYQIYFQNYLWWNLQFMFYQRETYLLDFFCSYLFFPVFSIFPIFPPRSTDFSICLIVTGFQHFLTHTCKLFSHFLTHNQIFLIS